MIRDRPRWLRFALAFFRAARVFFLGVCARAPRARLRGRWRRSSDGKERPSSKYTPGLRGAGKISLADVRSARRVAGQWSVVRRQLLGQLSFGQLYAAMGQRQRNKRTCPVFRAPTMPFRPEGTAGCSHGWSGDRREAGVAQRVEEGAFSFFRPNGAAEWLRCTRISLRQEQLSFIHARISPVRCIPSPGVYPPGTPRALS